MGWKAARSFNDSEQKDLCIISDNEIIKTCSNNMRLYGILEEEIRDAIKSPEYIERTGKRIGIHKTFLNRFSGYPLKVVYEEKEEVFVITAYPLKKAYRRHRHEG